MEAAAFYGFSPVLIPYGLPPEKAFKLLQAAGADYLIAAAGSLPLADLKRNVPQGVRSELSRSLEDS